MKNTWIGNPIKMLKKDLCDGLVVSTLSYFDDQSWITVYASFYF